MLQSSKVRDVSQGIPDRPELTPVDAVELQLEVHILLLDLLVRGNVDGLSGHGHCELGSSSCPGGNFCAFVDFDIDCLRNSRQLDAREPLIMRIGIKA